MTQYSGRFIEWILWLIDIGIFELLLRNFGEHRRDKKRYQVVAVLVMATVAFFTGRIFHQLPLQLGVRLMLYVIYAVTVYRMKYDRYVIVSFTYFLLDYILKKGIAFLVQWILPDGLAQELMRSIIGQMNIVLLSEWLVFFIIEMWDKHRRAPKEYFLKASMAILGVCCILSLACIHGIFKVAECDQLQLSSKDTYYLCWLVLGVFIVNGMGFIIIVRLNARRHQEKEYEMIQCQNELLEKTVLENRELEKEWRRNRHDFNNHLSCIDMLLQMENIPRARAYIQNLTQNYASCTSHIVLGNEIVEAVVSQKYLIAKKKQIKMTVQGSIEEKLMIDQMDLCALLSNSLDNAIEAVEKIENPEERWMTLKLENDGHYLNIQVENAVKEEKIEGPKKLRTTKKDAKHHGIGMTSMELTVQKYKGWMEWHCKDYRFKLVLVLPIVNHSE